MDMYSDRGPVLKRKEVVYFVFILVGQGWGAEMFILSRLILFNLSCYISKPWFNNMWIQLKDKKPGINNKNWNEMEF